MRESKLQLCSSNFTNRDQLLDSIDFVLLLLLQDLKKYFDTCQGEIDPNIVKVGRFYVHQPPFRSTKFLMKSSIYTLARIN